MATTDTQPACAGCALCDPAIAAYEAAVEEAFWAAELEAERELAGEALA